ncbi:hypothetical protein Tco_0960932 [Tanacetum coccineum]
MSNSNTNLQTQSSNALHNAIMEVSSKDRSPMYMENYKNVLQDIRDQLNAKVEAVQIILTGIDNDIYSTIDACPNACEMWKAIERLKQGLVYTRTRLRTVLLKMMNELVRNQCHVTNHQVNVQFLLQLQPKWQRKIYNLPTYNLRIHSKHCQANQDNSPRINRETGYDNQRAVNVAGARENIGLDDGIAASFQRSRIHKPHAHTQAFKVNPQVDQGSQIKMIQVKEMMQDNDLKNSKSKDKGLKSRSQSMNEQSRYKQDKTKTRQSINVKSHIFNIKGDNDKSKQTPTRMSSVVRSSLKKETSTLGEIVSLNYIKSNKNVIGLTKSN